MSARVSSSTHQVHVKCPMLCARFCKSSTLIMRFSLDTVLVGIIILPSFSCLFVVNLLFMRRFLCFMCVSVLHIGTMAISWLIKHQPTCVHSILLIDPVCLLTSLPKVAFSFVYKLPSVRMCELGFYCRPSSFAAARALAVF